MSSSRKTTVKIYLDLSLIGKKKLFKYIHEQIDMVSQV